LTSAARQAAPTFTGPAEKLSIAGTRPIVCKAKNVAATPVGWQQHATFSPTFVMPSSFSPRTCAPRISLQIGELPLSAGLRPPVARCRDCAKRSRGPGTSLVHDGIEHHRVDHDVLQRGARRNAGALCRVNWRVDGELHSRQEVIVIFGTGPLDLTGLQIAQRRALRASMRTER